MILYKYVPYKAGREIITGNSIGFACAANFNDPFELTGYPREVTTDPVRQLFADIRADAKRHIWVSNSAILSLTRSPLNALMWAHYAEAHSGFVIGFDVRACRFTLPEANLLPVQFGSVIYTEHRPKGELITSFLMEVGGEYSYRPELLEKLQRLFLYKPLCWSYEEEVRVVKCVKGIKEARILPSGTFTVLSLDGAKVYAVDLPVNAIVEVYVGVRNPLRGPGFTRFVTKVRKKNPGARVLECIVGTGEWTLESRETVHQKRNAERGTTC